MYYKPPKGKLKMTVLLVTKHGMITDRIITLSGIKYTTPQKNNNSLDDVSIEIEVSKIELTPNNPNIKSVVIIGAVDEMSKSVVELVKETGRTLDDVFTIMSLLKADYQNGDDYSVIALKNDGDVEELKLATGKITYYLYRADDRCRVFGSGEAWLYPFEGRIDTFENPLTMHEHMVLLHSFTSEFGRTYDHYDLLTNALNCKINLTDSARKKLHKSAVKKIANMAPLHPML